MPVYKKPFVGPYRPTKRYAHDTAKSRKWFLKSKYGITEQDYARMVEEQGNKCAICEISGEFSYRGLLHIDHCHETGKVRGLLCSNCNLGLGKFNDSTGLLTRAAEYLEERS